MRRIASVLMACALGLGLQLAAGGAGATDTTEELVDYGWWWQGHQRLYEVPPPAFVPEDGLYVAKDAAPDEVPPEIWDELPPDLQTPPPGSTAISAVSFFGPSGPGAILVLDIEAGSMPTCPEGPAAQVCYDPYVMACPVTASWFGEQAGLWESRPVGLCELVALPGEVIGEVPDQQMKWVVNEEFEVFPEFWSIVLVPDPQPTPFQITFANPATGSFVVDPALDGEEDDDAFPSFDEYFDELGLTPFDLGLTDDLLSLGDGAFDEGFGLEGPVATGRTTPVGPRAAREAANDLKARAVALLALAVLTAGLWALTRQSPRPSVVATDTEPGDPGAVLGGIGRFSRGRTSDPRRLL